MLMGPGLFINFAMIYEPCTNKVARKFMSNFSARSSIPNDGRNSLQIKYPTLFGRKLKYEARYVFAIPRALLGNENVRFCKNNEVGVGGLVKLNSSALKIIAYTNPACDCLINTNIAVYTSNKSRGEQFIQHCENNRQSKMH